MRSPDKNAAGDRAAGQPKLCHRHAAGWAATGSISGRQKQSFGARVKASAFRETKTQQ
jgi:hypothetical protein